MKQIAIVSLVAMLGMLVFPSTGGAKTCEELLAGNTYACTVVVPLDETRADEPAEPQTFCATFEQQTAPPPADSRDVAADPGELGVTVSLLEGTHPCTCLAKGKVKNPRFDQSKSFACLLTQSLSPFSPQVTRIPLDSKLSLVGKVGKRGIKKGLLVSSIGSQAGVVECTLDPECGVSPCGLEGTTCGGACPDGQTCLAVQGGAAGAADCQCVSEALSCVAADVCDPGLLCSGVFEECRQADRVRIGLDTGVCTCSDLIP